MIHLQKLLRSNSEEAQDLFSDFVDVVNFYVKQKKKQDCCFPILRKKKTFEYQLKINQLENSLEQKVPNATSIRIRSKTN